MKYSDYLLIDRHFSQEEIIIRDTVRAWVAEKFMPRIKEAFKNGTFPMDLVPEMAELGFFGVKSAEKYGGLGMGNVPYGIMCRELEYGDSGLRSFVSVQNSLVIYPIERFGSDEQKDKWLPMLISGRAIGAFGLTEPNAGSDPQSMKTHAVKDGDAYILNGSKQWITNGSIADVVVVWTKTEDNVVRGFLVERGMPGFSSTNEENKLSLKASITSSLFFDDVRIPAANLLPLTKNIGSALSCLNEARYGISWGVIGSAMSCYDTALEYAITRKQFGKPIASFQLTQEKLVLMLNEMVKAQILALEVARLKDEGKSKPTHISLAKMNNVKMALAIAREARSVLGANGISLEYNIIRHMANLESVYTYEGTNEVHLLAIGKDITGINAFE
jgi:glutaryl-CoA dehydrogenase